MHAHWLFVGNVFSHLVASMSGVASFLFSFWEHTKKRKIESRAFFIVGSLCLLVAFDQAWTDEHNNSSMLKSEKAALSQERDFWKQQSYGKDGALRSRDQLLEQNYHALIGEQSTANNAQNSLAQLSSKILDLNKPGPPSLAIRSVIGETAEIGRWKKYSELMVMPNRAVAASIDLQCVGTFAVIRAQIMDSHFNIPGSVSQIAPNHWQVKIATPQMTPDYPLLVMLGYDSTPTPCNVARN